MKYTYSFVVPIHNEAGNIVPLDTEIKKLIATEGYEAEVIYINDGSTDTSLQELRSLQAVTVIDLNRNYGQATALDAGFKASTGGCDSGELSRKEADEATSQLGQIIKAFQQVF